jgi:sulfofructose kinase
MASEKGIPRVLDFEDAGTEAITKLAWLADHVIFSADGLSGFTGVAEPDAGLSIARDKLGQPALGVTLGPQGSVWLTDEGIWRMTAPAIRARDTTGCGDVFHGAYAFSLARGLGVQGAARFATAAAAIKAQKGAGWLGMPNRDETDALVGRGW